jgi:hypothetical protein
MISFLGVRGETGTETELLAGLENIINPNSKEKFSWKLVGLEGPGFVYNL